MTAAPVEFEEAIKLTGFGKFNIALIILCGLCLFAVNFESYSIGYILPAAQCDFELDNTDKGILTSANFIGVIMSSHLWGYLGDTKGRKIIMIITLLLTFICTFTSTLITNFWLFTTLRFLSGFFICGPSALVYAYLGEFQSEKYRTISITFASVFLTLAAVGLPGLSWLIIPQDWTVTILNSKYKSWRVLLLIGGIPTAVVGILLLLFPESPKFLLSQGRRSEALDVLRKVYKLNTGNKAEHFPVHDVLQEERVNIPDNIFKSIWNQTFPLFYKRHIVNTLVACSIQFGLFAVSSGLFLWYPNIINELANNMEDIDGYSLTVCKLIPNTDYQNKTGNEIICSDTVDTSVFQQCLILGIMYGIGYVFIIPAVKFFGIQTFLVISLLVSGVMGICLCWATDTILINALFTGFLSLSGLCCAIVNVAVVQMFPTHLRAMAMCMVLMFGRIGSVVASATVGILLEINCILTFVIFASIIFVCAALSVVIPNHDRIEPDKNPREN